MEINKYGIKIRTVEIADAEFILSLRTDEKLGKYLSPTENDVEKQREWIKGYKQREQDKQEFYFLTLGPNDEKLGVNRLYNFKNNSFESGSWIFLKNAPSNYPILSDLIGREHGFKNLGFKVNAFNVNKKNVTVINYHKLFSPTVVKETNEEIFFELSYQNFNNQMRRFLRMFGKT